MSNIRIDIASEFKDKGFKQADKATTGLDKTLKQLGKTLVAVFSVQQVTAFAKASVKAFADDQKAATRLSTTLNNLGLAFEDPRVKTFISNLEATTGVLDDQLRPAFESLIRTTSSASKSQELLALAIDIAAGSGVDLQTVANDLSKAYVGNTRGIAKYNTGLTKAELQASSFLDIQELLTKQYSGQNAKYLETYAGKVSLLNVAYANMQETIGAGLVDAFTLLAGDSGIGGLTKAMEDFSTQIADVIRGVGVLADKLNNLPGLDRIPILDVGNIPVVGAWLKILQGLGENQRKNQSISKFRPNYADTFAETAGRTAAANAEAKRLKREKEIEALRKKAAAAQAKAEKERLKREKEAQQLKRAGTVFDLDAIQLVAALQNQVTEENRLRLTALLAIYNDNAEAADKLTKAVLLLQKPALENLGITLETGDNATKIIDKIINAQTKLFLLNTGIATIPKAKNPFEDWDSILDRLLGKINAIKGAISGFGGQGGGGGAGGAAGGGNGGGGGGSGSRVTANPTDPSGVTIQMPSGNNANPFNTFTVNGATIIANSGTVMTGQATDSPNEAAARQRIADIFETIGTFGKGGFNPTNVTVNVAGNVMSNDDLIQVITEGLYEVQKRGQSITLNAVAL